MGTTQSTEAHAAVEEVEEEVGAGGIPEPPPNAARLYKYNMVTSKWDAEVAFVVPTFYDAKQDSGGDSQWYLEISEADVDLLVNHQLQFVADRPAQRVTLSAGRQVWALRFWSLAGFNKFVQELEDKMFYNQFQVENNDDSRATIFGADFANAMYGVDDEPAAPADTTADEGPSQDELDAQRLHEEAREVQGDAIEGLVMGALQNSYMMRGTKMEVLRNRQGGVEDTDLSFMITPPRAANRPAFTPKRVLLADAETKFNMLSPLDRTKLFHADIETQQVVSEWTFQKDSVEIPILDIVTDSKAAQLETTNTFLGLDSNRLCRWDLRTAGGVVQESPVVTYTGGKDFARGTNFTCMATSGDGFVVVGASDGKVRLYSSKSLTRANTSIPGLGAPITAVDVTYDADWVLATTGDYLMVVHTTFTDTKSGKTVTGFQKPMGKNFRPPRLLRLKPEDALKTGGAPFSKGKFTWVTEQGRQERYIVASCGRYTVVWNFRRVKQSAGVVSIGGLSTCTDYFLTDKTENVVDSAFMHDNFNPVSGGQQQASLVVATPHKLFNIA